MRTIIFSLFFLTSLPLFAQLQTDSVFLFCYFKGGGDGLHYASSNDGLHWTALFGDSVILKPTVSRDKLFRDPNILKGADGKFHLVWTVSWADKGIGYASSTDLIHWSEQRFLPLIAGEDSVKNTWAPEISYDPTAMEYMIYWSSTVSGKFPQRDTSAEGQRYNHRLYYVTTKNFVNFSRPGLLYDPGFSVIDATIMQEGSKWVMFVKNETRAPVEKNLRVAYAKNLKGPYSPAGPAITGKYWAEGPTAIKTNGQWVVYFDKYIEKKYGAITSTDLLQWHDISDKVDFPKGARHGTVIKISAGEANRMKAARMR